MEEPTASAVAATYILTFLTLMQEGSYYL